MAVLTAKPLTARPLIARPLTARAIGEAVAAFSISDLFANGELGAAIGYSDARLLFQDVNGTEPATEVGDPYGLALSTSQGLRPTGDALGPEEVTNGDGESVTGWNPARASEVVTSTGGRIRTTADAGVVRGASQTISGLTVGDSYRLKMSVFTGTAPNNIFARVSETSNLVSDFAVNETASSDTDLDLFFTATATTMYVGGVSNFGAAGQYFELDDVSIRRVVPISERFAGLGDEQTDSSATYEKTTDANLEIPVSGSVAIGGTKYLLEFEYDNNASTPTVRLGASPGAEDFGQLESDVTGQKVSIVGESNAAGTGLSIFVAGAASRCTLRNVSLRELPGNHATQSTDTARPWRGRRPAGGVRNLLVNTEDLGDSYWLNNNGATASGKIITTAASANSGRRIDIDVGGDTTGVTLTFSAKLAEVSGGANWRVAIQEWDGASFVDSTVAAYTTVSESGDDITISRTGVGGTFFRVSIVSQEAVAGNQVEVLATQAELGSTATPYQRVAAPYDITEEGVASRFYAWDDEVDDDMTIVLPDLGTDATRVTVDRDGNVTYLENQTISGSVSVPLNSQAVIYIDRDLTADEKAGIEGLY